MLFIGSAPTAFIFHLDKHVRMCPTVASVLKYNVPQLKNKSVNVAMKTVSFKVFNAGLVILLNNKTCLYICL